MKSYSKYPDTKYKYKYYPLIWKDEGANILNIASIKNKYIEFIDLRVRNKTWNIKDRKLDDILNIPKIPRRPLGIPKSYRKIHDYEIFMYEKDWGYRIGSYDHVCRVCTTRLLM